MITKLLRLLGIPPKLSSREEFEIWADAVGPTLDKAAAFTYRRIDGNYTDPEINIAWQAWEAARNYQISRKPIKTRILQKLINRG